MPLKSLVAGTKVEVIEGNTCNITIDINSVVKGGVFGWLMGVLLMKPMMKWITKKLLNGLAYHAASGKLVGNKLPSQQEFSTVFRL